MWYDKRPQDTANGKSVMDIIYNSGKITRKFNSGKTIVLQKGMTGKEVDRQVWKTHDELMNTGKRIPSLAITKLPIY